MTGAGAVASHPITKGSALSVLITGGLYAASAAGIAIPGLAFTLGPLAGLLLYKFLPPKVQQEIDDTATKVIDTFQEIPKTYDEYPNEYKNPDATQLNIDK